MHCLCIVQEPELQNLCVKCLHGVLVYLSIPLRETATTCTMWVYVAINLTFNLPTSLREI